MDEKSSKNVILIYLTDGQNQYAIPQNIANACRVKENNDTQNSIASQTVFADLGKKHTKAGVLLKGLRTREGMSQLEFAKKIKVTQANLSKMENGKRAIGKIIAKRIEKSFKVNFRYFID